MRVSPSLRMAGTVAASAWLLATLLACGHGRLSGSLETGVDPELIASCLELDVSPHSDERIRELGWVGVEYELDNACDGAIPVDLSSALVLATPARPVQESAGLPAPEFYSRDVGDAPIVLSAWDPQEVLRAAMLDGGRNAREVIAYVVPPGLGDLDVCVELQALADTNMEPICFRWIGGSS